MSLPVVLTALASALALGACVSAQPNGGVANYDALRRARADCVAKGGELVLRKDGRPQSIDAYACERK